MNKSIIIIVFAFLLLSQTSEAAAQDTFGPICDGVTVTCAPTEPPAADTGVPGEPQPTTPIGEPPRSGHAETLLMFLGLSGVCMAAGVFLRRSFVEA